MNTTNIHAPTSQPKKHIINIFEAPVSSPRPSSSRATLAVTSMFSLMLIVLKCIGTGKLAKWGSVQSCLHLKEKDNSDV